MISARAYWHEDAACRTADPEELFADSTQQNRAKAVCTGCPVRTECLVEALDNRVEWGVWGEVFFALDMSHETCTRGSHRLKAASNCVLPPRGKSDCRLSGLGM